MNTHQPRETKKNVETGFSFSALCNRFVHNIFLEWRSAEKKEEKGGFERSQRNKTGKVRPGDHGEGNFWFVWPLYCLL